MSWFTIEEYTDINSTAESLLNHFETHCNWCWGHGLHNCNDCRKAFNRVYRKKRIEELRVKHGFAEKGETQ